jgi:hypothetical protein
MKGTHFSDFSSSLLGPKIPIRLTASASVRPPSSHWRRVRTSSMTMCSISTLSLSYKSAAVNWILLISKVPIQFVGVDLQCSCRPWRGGLGPFHHAPCPCTLSSFGFQARQLMSVKDKGLVWINIPSGASPATFSVMGTEVSLVMSAYGLDKR